MIVECSGCHTRYKIPDERIPVAGIKVRCPKCKVVFAVKREVEESSETLGEKLFGKDVARRPLGARPGEAARGDVLRESQESQIAPEGVGTGPGVPEGETVIGADSERGQVSPLAREETVTEEAQESKEPPESTGREEEETPREHEIPEEHEMLEEQGMAGEQEAREEQERREPERVPAGGGTEVEPPTFPPETPEQDARTLARALISDILFYNREQRDRGLTEDKILAYLGKEIARSWETYKERVGIEKAVETDYFREAVNEILAGGKRIL